MLQFTHEHRSQFFEADSFPPRSPSLLDRSHAAARRAAGAPWRRRRGIGAAFGTWTRSIRCTATWRIRRARTGATERRGRRRDAGVPRRASGEDARGARRGDRPGIDRRQGRRRSSTSCSPWSRPPNQRAFLGALGASTWRRSRHTARRGLCITPGRRTRCCARRPRRTRRPPCAATSRTSRTGSPAWTTRRRSACASSAGTATSFHP